MFKRVLVLTLAILLIASIAAGCKQQSPTPAPEASELVGGQTLPESFDVTDAARAVLEKALENRVGTDVTPVAYLASQVVAGTNHWLLCKQSPVVPDAKASYVVLCVYEDLSGKAEITNEQVLLGAPEEALVGGWTPAEDSTVTKELRESLEKGLANLDGADYAPIALLGTQVVAGTNYVILCRKAAVSPEAVPGFALLTLYVDLQGGAEVTEIQDVALSAS